MMCVEWWSFEVLSLRVGAMGTIPLAAQNIVTTILLFVFIFSYGVSMSSTFIIGNYVGAGDPDSAKKTAKWSFVLGVCICAVACLCLNLFGETLVGIFSIDQDVTQLAHSIVPYVSVFMCWDSMQTISQGTLKGTGKQAIGAVVVLLGCYGLSLPLAFWFAATDGLPGLWVGVNIGYMVMTVGMLGCVATLNWQKISQATHNLLLEMSDLGEKDLEAPKYVMEKNESR
jgi:MATE family multidrug resistance protein